jgi:ABC-2 type transport system permease protein
MTDTQQILIIASREFLVRVRSKVFLGTMAFMAVAIVGGIFALTLINGEASSVPLGVAGSAPPGLVGDIEATSSALETDVTVVEYDSRDDAVVAIGAGEVDAVIVDGTTIVANRAPSPTVTAILTASVNSAVRREIAADLGLSNEEVSAIVSPVQVDVEELDPEDPDEIARSVVSFLAAILLLTTIMIFGQFVAMGIVEEKQNRVVEVILAKVQTTSLLVGKVLGIGALGLLQVSVLAAAALLGVLLAPLPDLGVPDLTSIGVTAVVWLVFWFILGYLVYSFLYATLGATISRQEDLQSVAFIPAMAILPAYFLVSFTASSGGATPGWVKLASFVPIWSPILMPFRINTGDAVWWDVAIAVVLAVVLIVAMVRIGARVYRGAALRTTGKVSLWEAWSAAGD